MIGGADNDGRHSARTTTPPPSPSPSSPAQGTGGLGRRLLGSIRSLLPAPPQAAAAAPKVGLGLLLHLRHDHPALHPTPTTAASPSPSLEPEDDAAAAAAAPRPRAAAGLRLALQEKHDAGLAPVGGHVHGHQDGQFCAIDKPGASQEEEGIVGDKRRVLVEQQQQGGVVATQAGHDRLRAAGDDGQEVGEQIGVQPSHGTTCFHTATAVEHQDKEVLLELNATHQMLATAVDAQHNKVGNAVERRVRHDDDHDHLAMDDTPASQSTRQVSYYQVVSAVTADGTDGGIGKLKDKVKFPVRYPQRPGKLNCPFYMSKGTCSYGFSCQFNHPPLKAKLSEQGNRGVTEILELNRIGLPVREGARNCTYYMRNGACRYGKHCHFNHPEHVIDAQFNAPTGWEDSALQLEESSDHHTTVDDTSHLKKCSDDATFDDKSYLKKSSDHHKTVDDTSHLKKCSGDATFDDKSYSKKSSDHHTTVDDTSHLKKCSGDATLDDKSYSKKSSDHANLDDTSSSSEVLPPNILRMLFPPEKVLPSTEGKVKKDSGWSATSDDSDGCCSADSSDGPLCKQEHVGSSDGPLYKQGHVDYPERPGRPECPFYMRFGDCKFASACKYHHTKVKYPERPGEPECSFYMKNRFCKFGEQCRFNHPKDSNPTAQSPTDAKRAVVANEHHQPTRRITLADHMPQQEQYPERPGQPDCRFYMQFGRCKFMSTCIFHHPRGGVPVGWNPSGPAHSDQTEPETHGMPDCPFYIKSGKCQFGSACEFRHPKDTTKGTFGQSAGSAYANSTRPGNSGQQGEQPMYPERPGEPECDHYMRLGFCRYEMKCKYHHPAGEHSRKQQHGSTYH